MILSVAFIVPLPIPGRVGAGHRSTEFRSREGAAQQLKCLPANVPDRVTCYDMRLLPNGWLFAKNDQTGAFAEYPPAQIARLVRDKEPKRPGRKPKPNGAALDSPAIVSA